MANCYLVENDGCFELSCQVLLFFLNTTIFRIMTSSTKIYAKLRRSFHFSAFCQFVDVFRMLSFVRKTRFGTIVQKQDFYLNKKRTQSIRPPWQVSLRLIPRRDPTWKNGSHIVYTIVVSATKAHYLYLKFLDTHDHHGSFYPTEAAQNNATNYAGLSA